MEEVGKAFVIPAAQTQQSCAGAVWPRAFCAFDGCGWEAADGLEADLARHLEAEHAEDLEPVAARLLRPRCPDALSSVYDEAVAQRCRADAPLAGCSLDRTALRSFAKATAKDSVEALICFCCACVYTRVAEVGERSEIQWQRPLSRAPSGELLFFGRPAAAAEVVGLEHFLNKYDQLDAPGKKLSDHETFASWKLRLPGPDDVELLCCPEDHRCGAAPEHVAEGVLCEHCELPVCGECLDHLAQAELPPLSLANDMWTGYAPERIYAEEATVMELICASPCVTTLICMSMEAQFRSEAGALDEAAHMAGIASGLEATLCPSRCPGKTSCKPCRRAATGRRRCRAVGRSSANWSARCSRPTRRARRPTRRSRASSTRRTCGGRWWSTSSWT